MQVQSSAMFQEKKLILKHLLKELSVYYSYVSILAADSRGKRYSISKQGMGVQEDERLTEKGYVIRVYDGNSYAEYSFNELTEEMIPHILQKIRERLIPWKDSLSKQLGMQAYDMIPDADLVFEKSTDYQIHPEEMGDGAILEKMSEVRNKALAREEKILDCMIQCNYQIIHKFFLSTKKQLEQSIMWMTGAVALLGSRGEEVKRVFQGYSNCGGAEVLERMDQDIPAVTEMLLALLKSEPIVPGEYECICAPDVTGIIVHEAFGHGVEMDMFVKKRAMAEEYIGEYVASPIVTMHDGAAAAVKEVASFFFDDEGTIAQDTIIIEKGVLKRGLSDAQSAMALHIIPSSNGRRESTQKKAYTRMTNTFFEGGTDKLEDMIASISYGFLLENASSGMEDPKNWGIQCMVNIAREIKDGQLTGKVFSPVVLTGYVPELLKSISMMSEDVKLGGCGFCGKGYKEWVKVSDGGSYMKARIRLG